MAEDFLKLNMEEYLPLREVVFRTLRQAILKGELKPGERLLELHLADRLGVSRTPIREAGAEVARISEKGLQDVLEVRRALEELSVELACARIREDGLRQLKAILKEEQNAMAQENVKAFIQGDIDFHDAIYKAADNQRLEQLINNLQEQIYRYRLEYIKDLKQWPVILEEHAKVIETLEAQDVAAAREAICTHISNQEMNVRERLLHEN